MSTMGRFRPYSTIFADWLKGRIRVPDPRARTGFRVAGNTRVGPATVRAANAVYIAGSAYVLVQAIRCAIESGS